MTLLDQLLGKKKHSKKGYVTKKEFEEMKEFLVAQVQARNKQIDALKEEKKVIMNMAFKHKNEDLKTKVYKSTKKTKKNATK